LFQDGAVAWDAKDYLIEQERCEEVTIEQKSYPGKHSDKGKEEAKKAAKEVKEKARKQVSKSSTIFYVTDGAAKYAGSFVHGKFFGLVFQSCPPQRTLTWVFTNQLLGQMLIFEMT
jgi:hypothetical protein